MVSLKPDHQPTAGYVKAVRHGAGAQVSRRTTFYFLPADMITQILNFGLPAPIDVQIDGADIDGNRAVADRSWTQVRRVPGIVDARIQQEFDYPDFQVHVDRTKAQQDGLTEQDVAGSVLDTLSGSFQTAPMFFLNWKNGVNYNLVAQTPQYDIQSLQDLQNIPITGPTARAAGDPGGCRHHQALAGDGGGRPLQHPPRDRHLCQRAGPRPGRRRRATSQRIVDANRHLLPRGSFVTLRGQLETMRSAYVDLLAGLAFSIVLVYLLIVVNFQSWLDPFIIITALAGGAGGHRAVPVLHRTRRSACRR